MDRYEFRMQDFSLDPDDGAVLEAFADFFATESLPELVRAAEPLGHDKALWTHLLAMGVGSMSLPAAYAGDGATLLQLVLVAEELGRAVAPVPFISHVVATRLLARAGADADVVAWAADGERIVTLALQAVSAGERRLVPDAAVAADVIAYDGDALALFSAGAPSAHVPNQGRTPLGWWQADESMSVTVLARGERAAELYAGAVTEWKLLLAAALTGMTEAALKLAVEFCRTRETLGVPIGTLQGVAFPLVDVHIGIVGARNLVRKAAWMIENEPGVQPELAHFAFAHSTSVATKGTTVSAHMQGGLGFTSEADASLYFLRAKGWGVLAGNPAEDLKAAGRLLVAAAAH